MIRLIIFFACLIISASPYSNLSAEDWPVWRGPNKNGIAAGEQSPPLKWDENTNVVWKTEIPGMGHCSPVIVGNKIFLSTAENTKQSQSVICVDRETGKSLWNTTVNDKGLEPKIHTSNTHASATIATANNLLFVVFNNQKSIQLAALDFDGNVLWNKNIGSYHPKFPFGYGSSPCIYEDLVIVLSDYPKDGFIAAFNQKTGKKVWQMKRGETSSFATPIVAKIDGKDHLLVSGTDVRSYDPKTGKQNWLVEGPWKVTCGTPVWEGNTIFVGGGYPAGACIAVSASDGNIIWNNPAKSYEQSLLVHDGYVYCHSDSGVAYCWRASDGKEMWKQRATGKGVSVSPILVGNNIFMTSEKGETAVIAANPDEFEQIGKNKLGGSAYATPAFVDNKMYTRVGAKKGTEPQYLYCIGKK